MIDSVLLTPLKKFIKVESLSGILLFFSTLIAMIWTNSHYGTVYQSIWNYKIGLINDNFEISKPIILWINDGLMAIFFFLIGLEIKREIQIGELNTIKKAAFPVIAGVGGMVVPIIIFLLLNKSPETSVGWGIPMATDIAFTLAILNLVNEKIPISVKIFLTAFAIVDDLGAVLIIALFYSKEIHFELIFFALLIMAILYYLSYKGFYSKYITLFLGILVWFLFLKSGIHPTVAGVLLAFTVPLRQKINIDTFTRKVSMFAKSISVSEQTKNPILTKDQIEQIDNLVGVLEKFQPPLQYIEHKLQRWVVLFIMPIFGFANAGIVFGFDLNLDYSLIINLALSLFLGKFIGISLFSFIGIRLNITELPENVNFWHIIGVAILAGVGFTMSIFIAHLSFSENPTLMDSAKIGILLGSILSGILGSLILVNTSKNYKRFY